MTKILKSIKDTYLIEKMKGKNQNQNPPPPFITSTLQQDSYSKCGFSVKRTMSLAQNLYEKGFITYMRTDSTLLSQNITFEIKGYILDNKNYGEKYYKTRQFKTKNKNAQEAHECIRPTKICTESVSNVNGLTSDHQKLYNLIWKRTVASQMAAAQFYERRIILSGKKNKYKFLGSHKDLLFDGYLKLLESIGPARSSYIGVVMPVIALIISTIFEDLEWEIDLMIGLPILLVGAVLVINQKIKSS